MRPTKRVLVMSDDPVLLEFLQHNLGDKGYAVTHTKANGQDLRKTVGQALPDFAIIDIVMPSMDGIELCLRLRQCSQVPIMMLSTWGAGKDKVRGLDLSADGYLTDPFGIIELVDRMEEAYSRDAASRSLLPTTSSEAA
jgi:DNA-binding response OmpR family regulator